jgi:uncharacterized membrane protein
MKTLANIFIKGLLFALPIAVTFGLLYWLFVTSENLLKTPMQKLLPNGQYIPGMGIASALVLIFVLGLLVQNFLTHRILAWLEQWVEQIPVVKTIYNSAKDLTYLFAGNQQDQLSRVVSITLDGDIKLIGFVTSEEPEFGVPPDCIAVYFPMSYQVGGYTAYVPKSRCEFIDIPAQKALQLVLTAHVKRPNNLTQTPNTKPN